MIVDRTSNMSIMGEMKDKTINRGWGRGWFLSELVCHNMLLRI